MRNYHLILASNSPRRKELLGWTGWSFNARPADVDESTRAGEDPAVYVARLALTKGKAGAAVAPSGSLVLAADTIVAAHGELLGKPRDAHQAAAMLRSLRAQTHQVYTALTLVDTQNGRLETELCCSDVPMRAYTEEEIRDYVESGDPLDKAGAYAIQHPGFHPVEAFRGCYASVMGLPLCHLARSMGRLGWNAPANIPEACQANLSYRCPIYQAVMAGQQIG